MFRKPVVRTNVKYHSITVCGTTAQTNKKKSTSIHNSTSLFKTTNCINIGNAPLRDRVVSLCSNEALS